MSDMTQASDPMGGAPAPQGGFCIEISCLPDGTFSVSSESLEEEAAEEQGAPGSEMGQPAKSFGDALKLALDIFKAGGNAGQPEADLNAGFQSPDEPTMKAPPAQ